MKKILSVIILALIFLCGQNNFANAQDVYVGTSNTTGRDCYVVTESIFWEVPAFCTATLKMINPSNGNVQLLNYEFIMMKHWVEFKNSQGFNGRVNDSVPIEKAMWDFIFDYSTKNKMK